MKKRKLIVYLNGEEICRATNKFQITMLKSVFGVSNKSNPDKKFILDKIKNWGRPYGRHSKSFIFELVYIEADVTDNVKYYDYDTRDKFVWYKMCPLIYRYTNGHVKLCADLREDLKYPIDVCNGASELTLSFKELMAGENPTFKFDEIWGSGKITEKLMDKIFYTKFSSTYSLFTDDFERFRALSDVVHKNELVCRIHMPGIYQKAL